MYWFARRMNFCICRGNYQSKSWQDLFDLIVVGANKPSFLKNDYLPIFRVDP